MIDLKTVRKGDHIFVRATVERVDLLEPRPGLDVRFSDGLRRYMRTEHVAEVIPTFKAGDEVLVKGCTGVIVAGPDRRGTFAVDFGELGLGLAAPDEIERPAAHLGARMAP